MSSAAHLRELGEFLKVRRAQLRPAQVGLREHGHTLRRVAGLRREEVAQLAAISTDYYMRIEQGRLAPSPPVLAALVRELRLDDDQASYVQGLVAQAGRRTTPRRRTPRAKVHPHLVPKAASGRGFDSHLTSPSRRRRSGRRPIPRARS